MLRIFLSDVQTYTLILIIDKAMAVVPVVPVLLIVLFSKCRCEPTNGLNYNKGNGALQYDDILRPPPPPPLSIAPVPFHGGVGRLQRQNNDIGYMYQSPPSIAPTANTPVPEFNFPAPFYKQYNFNFVPPPQPFSTTPSPTIFQKISGWLFSSQQVSETGTPINNNILKKDCNPCNSVPWIPVIRYDLGNEKGRQNINPTYGPPSPTATNDFNTLHGVAQPFQTQSINYKPTGTPHVSYGPPSVSPIKPLKISSSTYGPPSPTHVISVLKQSPFNTPYSLSSSSMYEPPSISNFPASSYLPSSLYTASSTYKPPSFSYEYQFSSTTQSPISTGYRPEFLNQHLPTQNDIEIISDLEPPVEQQLPKVSYPIGFKNSYGEPIINSNVLDIPYSAPVDESTKLNSQVQHSQTVKSHIPNMSLALANPAPFSSNRGRNIHTLQPVALPNLSVSPLPPIFNARPFRTVPIRYPYNLIQDNLVSNNINIDKSIPIAEYTHLEYPTTVIQSPVIDIDTLKNMNHSKGYRNIQNSYVIDEVRDISPQASEDHTHISKAKSKLEASFESFGPDFNNDLYDAGIPLEIQQPNVPHNHKVSFADLRGLKDEDIDKYRTESNLQYIDSPLLYLKPSAPHKNYKDFGFTLSTPKKNYDYEIYDDNPTTSTPIQNTVRNDWEENKPSFIEATSPSIIAQENIDHPKIVQIIVPYTSGQRNIKTKDISHQQEWMVNAENEYQGRKIHANTENSFASVTTEGYKSLSTTTEESISVVTDQYESELLNTPALNDMYDVKEPPFDIIKLQHNIDDWTAQEYSNHYGSPQRSRSNEKYSKKIPDEYFTTTNPLTNYPIDISNTNYDLYDHEVSSSIQHTVTDNKTNIFTINRKDYNTIEKNKNVHESAKNEELEYKKRFHIYTAASFFRSTTSTTTPAPWEQIQTSISPLTNEKVYVVTSKPWRENLTKQNNLKGSEDKRVDSDDTSDRDDLPFKSPRFSNRPSYGFTAGAIDSMKLDSPYGYSNGWHRRINNLGNEDYENTSKENESDLIPTTIKDI